MPRRSTVIAASAMAIAVLSSGVVAASATSLGGLASRNLWSSTFVGGSAAPVVLAWENFNGANGTNLVGTVTDGGAKSWSVNPAGAWTISGNQASSASTNSSLVINPGQWNYTVAGTVVRNGATAFDAGFTLDRNSAGTQFLTCEWTSGANGTLEVWKYTGVWTLLGSVTNLYPGGIATAPATIALACGTTATGVTAAINGVTLVAVTLSAADQTTFKNATHQFGGLYQWISGGSTFDDVHVDSP